MSRLFEQTWGDRFETATMWAGVIVLGLILLAVSLFLIAVGICCLPLLMVGWVLNEIFRTIRSFSQNPDK